MNTMILCASDTSLLDAFLYALVGFVIVLSVLALLVGIFYLTGRLFQTKAFGKEKLFDFGKKPKSVEFAEQSVDDELVAAITAAISVVLESENDDIRPDFVIRRITRKK